MSITPAFDPDRFPPDLLDYPNFVAWRVETRGGKPTKVPVNPRTGRLALTTVPLTWATFEEALPFARSEGLGIGFVFSADDPFAGVDLDGCIEEEARRVKPWAWGIVSALASYTEVSPSGTGLKVFLRGVLPPGRNRKGPVEMYDRARFFTMTGCHVPGMPAGAEERQGELAALHVRTFPPQQPLTAPAGPTPLRQWDDAEVIQRAMSATNGVKFSRLWLGDRGGYDSDSEADAALVSLLAFWTGPDAERLDALFRQSRLMRAKWERASYRDRTIALALKRAQFYRPRVATAPRQALSFARRPA
jgi:primase-polymerase (primpol)-like protein